MMTTMPHVLGKKKTKPSMVKGLQPPKALDAASKKPMMKPNKQAPMLGRNIGKKK